MIKQILLEGFNKNVKNANLIKGRRVLQNDLISEINIDVQDESILIKSNVVSESLFSEYACEMEIFSGTNELVGTHCSCMDFEKNEFKKDNYCCKHLVATFYTFLNKIDSDEILRNKITNAVGRGEKTQIKAKKNDDL